MNNESLKQENSFLKKMIRTYYQPEIERLNNIINELEKDVENRLMPIPDDVYNDILEENREKEIREYIMLDQIIGSDEE